jgi:DNA-binding MarR family transcriptional regulator
MRVRVRMSDRDRIQQLGITPRQHDVLKFLREYVAEKGFSPTQNEIGRHLGCSAPNICRLMRELELRGMVVRAARLNRSVVPA